jgi:hypothetical protein
MRKPIIRFLLIALSAASNACALPPVNTSSSSNSFAAQTSPTPAAAEAQAPCVVNATKICQDNARERPALFMPDAVKGQSAVNPSNLVAFAAPLQIPGGPQLKIACYYRPGTMAVVYARAWAVVAGDQLVDLNPQAGKVLNSPGAPIGPPLNDRNYRFLNERGYCLPRL